MKLIKENLFLILSTLFFLLLSASTVGIAKENELLTSDNFGETTSPSFSYVTHVPIEITQDSEFDVAHGISSGTVTVLDPFILEGLNISTTSGHGISISDTTKHFIIRNCWVDAGNDYSNTGIYLDGIGVGTAIIEENTCLNSYYGIQLVFSSNNSLTSNNCSNNSIYGIALMILIITL